MRTTEHRFDVLLKINGKTLPVRVDETVVDDYFDSGSVEAEKDLARILDRALMSVSA